MSGCLHVWLVDPTFAAVLHNVGEPGCTCIGYEDVPIQMTPQVTVALVWYFLECITRDNKWDLDAVITVEVIEDDTGPFEVEPFASGLQSGYQVFLVIAIGLQLRVNEEELFIGDPRVEHAMQVFTARELLVHEAEEEPGPTKVSLALTERHVRACLVTIPTYLTFIKRVAIAHQSAGASILIFDLTKLGDVEVDDSNLVEEGDHSSDPIVAVVAMLFEMRESRFTRLKVKRTGTSSEIWVFHGVCFAGILLILVDLVNEAS